VIVVEQIVMRMIVSLVIACCVSSSAPAANGPVNADLLLVGGSIHDGSGAEPIVGDVAIQQGRIVAVGKFVRGKIAQTIDCSGLIVTAGFIDLHSHSDSPIVAAATRANVNFVTQGCTTVVTGNCGSGPTDVAAYFKKIETSGAGTNVIHLIPHGAVRDAVMGKTARDPTTDELQKMRDLCDRSMRDGAWGMATGLIYVPGTYSKTAELVELSKIVAAHGGFYASHIRGEGSELLTSVEEALTIGREAKLPVHVSHFKASGRDAWGSLHLAIEMIEKARASGQTATADQYPYTASSTSLEATVLPTWSREGGREGIRRRLADAEDRAKIRKHVERALGQSVRLQIAGYAPRHDWVGKSVDEVAKEENKSPVDVALEIEEHGGARIVNFNMHEDDVRTAMKRPWVATASDGSAKVPDADVPHPRNFGTFTRKLGRYAFRESVVPPAQAIRSCNGLPADILKLTDRGYLRVGYAADVTVFEPQEILDKAEFDRPYQYSVGIRYVFVNGVPTLYAGTPTGALPGKPLRHAAK
jgi:N-acyl-D-aspartate/D-glutamate deacylase